jgi:glycosyltransferase involved in cell wall biosynthesis
VIVVNDGSADDTPAVIAEAATRLPLAAIHHTTPLGRSGAANAGARAARGDLLIFMDGDTLAHPELVARHIAIHSNGAGEFLAGRGETFHLRGTRFLKNPETGEPWPDSAARLSQLASAELTRLRVTLEQVTRDFSSIERRAEPGIYPGAAPRRLYELEMEALEIHGDCQVLWAAASGCNFSVRRSEFLRIGGFDERLDINEHRELALRLCQAGARMVPVRGARSFHLTHRSAWRDPLKDTAWETVFYRAHPIPAVKLLAIFWASLPGMDRIPMEARIASLPALEAAARGETGIDYDAVRRLILELPDWSARAAERALPGTPIMHHAGGR